MNKASKHVVPSTTGGWAVKSAGSTRALKVFPTQADAVIYARDAAKKANSELFIHGRDGTIKERNTYGRDPMPPKDKR